MGAGCTLCVSKRLLGEGVMGPNIAFSGVLNYEFVQNRRGKKVHSWLK